MGHFDKKKTRNDVRDELARLNAEAPCMGYTIRWWSQRDSAQLHHETVWSDGSSGGVEILCQGTRVELWNHLQAMRDGVRAIKSVARWRAGLDLRAKDPSKWGMLSGAITRKEKG